MILDDLGKWFGLFLIIGVGAVILGIEEFKKWRKKYACTRVNN